MSPLILIPVILYIIFSYILILYLISLFIIKPHIKNILDLNYKNLKQQQPPANRSFSCKFIFSGHPLLFLLNILKGLRLKVELYQNFMIISFFNMATVVKYDNSIKFKSETIKGNFFIIQKNGYKIEVLTSKNDCEYLQSLITNHS